MAAGKVWLVGAGPGDPDLITVRGRRVLEQAEVVLHDALSHPSLLEYCQRAQIVNVGKRYGERSPPQAVVTQQLLHYAGAGKRVVRLKGGDPFMFARGAEEALALVEAGVDFEIVPGVSSPVAASAYAGISFTHRDLSSSVTFITGSDREGKDWSPESWHKLATATDTICVLMGMRRIDEICQAIIKGGRSPNTPVAVIQWGARPEQRVVRAALSQIASAVKQQGITNPAVIVVGEVVELRDRIAWFDTRPLFGKRILVPRPPKQARGTARLLRDRAAEPLLFSAISIEDPPDPEPLRQAARDVGSYDWVLFTSANGVECFMRALNDAGRDARAFGNAKLGVIGPKTAQSLVVHGLRADLVADEYIGESLAEALLAEGNAQRVLIPRALEAREVLPERLRAAGLHVDVVPAYETKKANPERRAELEALISGQLDVVMFTSSSTVSALCDVLGQGAADLLSQVTVAAIGPVTAKTASELGLKVDVTAEIYTVEGLLDALEQHFVSHSPA
jgi:uroporphyrinogen III methyltransferase/synthase